MATAPKETLGLRILLARTRLRMTLSELEKKTGIPNSLLSRYERDVAVPTVPRLQKLVKALRVTLNELLGYGEQDKAKASERGAVEATRAA